MKEIAKEFFDQPVDIVARQLIGSLFLVRGIGGIIVETEAYDQNDPASHCYNEKCPGSAKITPMNKSMFLSGGHLYVYPDSKVQSTKGYCFLNFTTGNQGTGSAVLIRALQPKRGCDEMRKRRARFFIRPDRAESVLKIDRNLCSGPNMLCQALDITRKRHDGISLFSEEFELYGPAEKVATAQGPRVNISKAKNDPRRYVQAGSEFISMLGDDRYPLTAEDILTGHYPN